MSKKKRGRPMVPFNLTQIAKLENEYKQHGPFSITKIGLISRALGGNPSKVHNWHLKRQHRITTEGLLKKKRGRPVKPFTPAQTAILENEYNQHGPFSETKINQLSSAFCCNPLKVQKWYLNKEHGKETRSVRPSFLKAKAKINYQVILNSLTSSEIVKEFEDHDFVNSSIDELTVDESKYNISKRCDKLKMIKLILLLKNRPDKNEISQLAKDLDLKSSDVSNVMSKQRYEFKNSSNRRSDDVKYKECNSMLEEKFKKSSCINRAEAENFVKIIKFLKLTADHILIWFKWKKRFTKLTDDETVMKKRNRNIRVKISKSKNSLPKLIFLLSNNWVDADYRRLAKDLNLSKKQMMNKSVNLEKFQTAYNEVYEKLTNFNNIIDEDAEDLATELNKKYGLDLTRKCIQIWLKWRNYFSGSNEQKTCQQDRVYLMPKLKLKRRMPTLKDKCLHKKMTWTKRIFQPKNRVVNPGRALKAMETAYKKNNELSKNVQIQLSRKFGLTELEVKNWFDNRKRVELFWAKS